MKYIAIILVFGVFNMSAQSEKNNELDEIFKIVEDMPRFPGCENEEMTRKEKVNCSNEKLSAFVAENLVYPEQAKLDSIQGTVVVKFVVDRRGEVRKVQVIRGIGGGCEEEAVRVVEAINEKGLKFIPGKQRGRQVNVQLNLPIKFKL